MTNSDCPKWRKGWPSFGLVALFVAIGIFIRLPHRTQTLEAHATLQSGMKMNVRFTLQSPHGWASPTRAVGLDVSINGNHVPVAKEAYYGLQPFDPSRKPLIAETKGFPEIIMRGDPKASFTEVRWHFLNYSFSELEMVRGSHEDVRFYGGPVPQLAQANIAKEPYGEQPLWLTPVKIVQYDFHRPVIAIGEESIKKASIKDLKE